MESQYSLADAGVSQPESEQKRIRDLVQLVSAFSASVTLLSIIAFAFLRLQIGIILGLSILPVYLLSVFLSKKIKLRVASNFLIISFITHISVTSLFIFPREYGFHYCLLVIPSLIWIIFGKRQIEKPIYASISLLFFYLAEYTDLFNPIITSLDYHRLFHMFSIMSFNLGTIIGMRYYVHYINRDTNKLSKLACTDGLTGLENKRFLEQTGELDFDMIRRAGKNLSVLMIDLDHFKAVNDNYGHDAGDNILREVGKTLKSSFRSADRVCRFGGEEFIVLLKGTGPQDSLRIAEELRQKIENLEFPVYAGLKLTTSIGIAHMSDEDASLKKMTLRADKALYYAKEAGRNCVKNDQNSSMPSSQCI
ncbi:MULTISPECIES: diguanylate cyclase [unclassified Oceanispirochaeta]|uniref:GGDEF domain-containing protein n=1 Tax=unclassified Oceanispirochaeta TaxID=2635722 RepID=UPI0011C052A5|nr:GGDEF domain-containing protein [Oceanispirochaeta sp. M1]MBF9018319.1 GGDEF domain-containing protein [Oceanispirochaeta sp. M2]NPD74784.1 GGDEF domain-containing protein [Oceanispirochaeta sp. M1]